MATEAIDLYSENTSFADMSVKQRMYNEIARFQQLIHTLQDQSRTYFLKAMDMTTGAVDAINEIEKEMIDASRSEDGAAPLDNPS